MTVFETMKRGGAGSLENVVTSSRGHKGQTPDTVPIRPFAKDQNGIHIADLPELLNKVVTPNTLP
ncbi:hypothetical protein [Profundibacter sp.]